MINKKFKKLTSLMLMSSLLTPNLLVKADTNNISNNVNRLDESDLFIEDNDNVSVGDSYVNLINGSNVSTYEDDSNVDTPPNDVTQTPNDGELEKVVTVLENNWDKSYTGSLSSSATIKTLATTDGGYIVAVCDGGKLSLNKFTKSGTLDWKKEYPATITSIKDMDYVSDGSILITSEDFVPVKNDVVDKELTEEQTGVEFDGKDSNHKVPVISKFDLDGNLIWSRYIDSDNDLVFNNTEVLEDGSFVSVGYSVIEGHTFPSIARIDYDGNVLWNDLINSAEGEFVDLVIKDNSLIAGFNGDGDLFGSTPLGGKDIILVNYSLNGDKAEFKLIGGSHDETLKSMDLDKQGNILLMGTFESADVFSGFASDVKHTEMVLELDSSYEPVWGYSVGYDLQEMLVSIDGTLLLSGNGTSSILNKKNAYLESVKKGQESTVLDFRFNGAKNNFYYSSLIQLADNSVIAGSLITESKNSYVNIRSLSLGLESTDLRHVALTATLKDGSIIDAVNSLDKRYITLRLNKSGKYTDIKSIEGASAKALTPNDDGGFTFIYVSKDSKTIKSKYDPNGTLLEETVITDSNSNNNNNAGGSTGGNNNSTNSGNNSNSTNSGNSDSINNGNNSNSTNNGNSDSTNNGNNSNDNSAGNTVIGGGSNQGGNNSTQDVPNENDNITSTDKADDSVGGSTQGSANNSTNTPGLSEMKNYSGTLPYTGIDGTDALLLLGVVALGGGLLYMFVNNRYYSKKFL